MTPSRERFSVASDIRNQLLKEELNNAKLTGYLLKQKIENANLEYEVLLAKAAKYGLQPSYVKEPNGMDDSTAAEKKTD